MSAPTAPINYTVKHRQGKWAEARAIREQLPTFKSQAETGRALGISRSYVEILELSALAKVAKGLRERMKSKTENLEI